MAEIPVYPCTLCNAFQAQSFARLLRHIRFLHSFDASFHITCGINGCQSSYKVFDSYLKHIQRKHPNQAIEEHANQIVDDQANQAMDDHANQVADDEEEDPIQNDESDNDDQINVENMEVNNDNLPENFTVILGKFILKTREKQKLTNKATQSFLSGFEELMDLSHDFMITEIKGKLQNAGMDGGMIEDLNLDGVLEPVKASFEQLGTSTRQIKFFKDHFDYIEPVEVHLGFSDTGKKENFQYIPIMETLKSLLKYEDVASEVMQSHQSADGKLRDFCDGTVFKSHEHFSNDDRALQLEIYNDDFNVCNPLGNVVKTYKVTPLYFVLGNIQPNCRSKVHVIQLICLCRTVLVRKYGWEAIMAPFLRDAHDLADTGISVVIDGAPITFKGYVSFLCADNLAAHWLGGFMEGFTALRPCRYCMASKEEIQIQYRPEYFQRRTKEGYDHQVEMVEMDENMARIYGVKRSSELNQLPCFHIVQGCPPDIAHDLFEGVVNNVLQHCILEFVNAQFFTLKTLNDIIQSFQYKAPDIEKKPHPMAETPGSFHIKQTASQAWCLLRLLPCMIGQFIPHGNPFWELVLALMDVVDLVCSPEHTVGSVAYLSTLIVSFQEQYRQCFTDRSCIPKMHFMVHYPQLILQYGPLVHCQTLRFEAKHSYFKQVAGPVKCFKNICLTLAKRHQLFQCLYQSSRNSFFFKEDMEETGGEQVPLRQLPGRVQELINPYTASNLVYHASSVSVAGTKYVKESCVVIKFEDENPVFGSIKDIFITNGAIRLLVTIMHCRGFYNHYHAYSVTDSDNLELIHVDELLDHRIFACYPIRGRVDESIITLRSRYSCETIF